MVLAYNAKKRAHPQAWQVHNLKARASIYMCVCAYAHARTHVRAGRAASQLACIRLCMCVCAAPLSSSSPCYLALLAARSQAESSASRRRAAEKEGGAEGR